MRIMGIDFGESRIGLAISDPLGWTAQGLDTLSWKGILEVPVKRISRLITEYGATRVVVGYPKNMDGSVGKRAVRTDEFINEILLKSPGIEIIKWDERLTSMAAHRVLKETGVKTMGNKGAVDKIAAIYILQGYLDSISVKKV